MGRHLLRSLGQWLPFALLAFGPVAVLLATSVFPGGGEFSLRVYREALLDEQRLGLLWNSLCVGVGVAAVTLTLGIPLGFLLGRTDLKGRFFYGVLLFTPLLIPPYVLGIAWTQVASIGGYDAIVLLLSATYLPIVVLLCSRGFRDVDAQTEEAALLKGPVFALRRVTLPLARPSILTAALLVFVLAISDFCVPDFFSFAGVQDGSFQVFATDVYFRWATLTDVEGATAAALPLVALAALCVLWIASLEGRRSYSSVRGSHHRPRNYALGRWQPAAHLLLWGIWILGAGVPLFVLSRWAVIQPPEMNQLTALPADLPEGLAPSAPTLLNLLRSPAGGDLLRSLLYSVAAVLLLLVLSLGPAAALSRRRTGRPLALVVVLLPLAFPSLLVGMAQVHAFNHPGSFWDQWYRGGGLVILTLATRLIPLGVLGLRASWVRLDPEIEQSSQLLLQGNWRRWHRILLPLLAPGMLATGLLCFGLAMRDLDVIVLLEGAQHTLPLRIYNKVHYARDAEVAMLCLLQLAAVMIPALLVWLLVPRWATSRPSSSS
jgi:iron(III) transport system permease protein